MNKLDLKTELAQHAYDYSEIRKNSIPEYVLIDLAESYMKRNNITYYHRVKFESLDCYVALAEPAMMKYTNWRSAFYAHGYDAPILHLVAPRERD